jgi:hypothetical protein
MEMEIGEDRLAERLGVGRDVLRRLRDGLADVQEHLHWRKDGGRVVWLAAGVAVVEASLGLQDAAAEAVCVVGRMMMRVTALPRNRRIVEGVAAGDDRRVVRVVVRDSGRLCVGLLVECEQVRGDLWEMVGRGPRSRREAQRRVEAGQRDGAVRGLQGESLTRVRQNSGFTGAKSDTCQTFSE